MPIIIIRNADFGYYTHSQLIYKSQSIQKVILSQVSASLQRGSLTCLIGRNGCGKSTLLRTIAQLQPLLAGNLLFCENNRQAESLSETDLCRMNASKIARHIGIVLTEQTILNNTTVRQLVSLGRIPYSNFICKMSEDDRNCIDNALLKTGLMPLADRFINTLSDGEKQKVMIAKSIAQNTEILLLDEPSCFLDYPSKIDLMILLQKLAHEENKTILLSTHDIHISLKYADKLWHIKDRKLTEVHPKSFCVDNL